MRERYYLVRRPDGRVFVPADAARDNDGRVYSRLVADMFARECGGTVEVVNPK